MQIERFEDLDCWKQARVLTSLVYNLCESQRLSQDGRLRVQLTGAAISVMNNIAEGFGSQSNPEFKRFLGYARRSVSEVQSSLYVAFDRKFVSGEEFQFAYEQSEATRKVIDGLLRYLRSKRTQRN
ncbi:MAG: four helix bundle protein [Nitrospirota bacterium]